MAASGATPTAPDFLSTVRAAAAALTAEERRGPILVGVSGGPDSLALLHLLWRWSAEGGPPVRAVHVDHRLRRESGEEGARVAAFCAARAIPIALRRVPDAALANSKGGTEDAARRARYALFADEARAGGARVLALGHHADDQAETLLLHLLRGSGLGGLGGMPVVRRAGDGLDPLPGTVPAARPALWRPLLGLRRADLAAYCRARGLEPSHDSTNDDPTFRRNALRVRVLPLLEKHFPDATAILARDAGLLADDEAWLAAETARAWARCGAGTAGVALARAPFRAEPIAARRRLVRYAWGAAGGAGGSPGAAAVEAACAAIATGKTGARAPLPGGIGLLIERDVAHFGRAATLEDELRDRLPLPLAAPGWFAPLPSVPLELGRGWTLVTDAAGGALHIPVYVRRAGTAVLRTWQPGDRVMLPGGRGSQKVQDWFVDHGVPGYARRQLILLAEGGRVLAILGLAAFPPLWPVSEGETLGGFALGLLYNGRPRPMVTPGGWRAATTR